MAHFANTSKGPLIPGRWVAANGRRAASFETSFAAANSNIVFTAQEVGTDGNDITITFTDPAAASQALSVSVSGTDIDVSLATDGANAITSTADEVKAAVDGDGSASALVSTADADGNDGTGVVEALSQTSLTGGRKYIIGRSR